MEFSKQDCERADDRILAFDTLFTTNQIQKLKIVISFMDNQMQKQMAVYIKIMELQYTIAFFHHHPYRLCGCFEQESPGNFRGIYNALRPYSNAHERNQMEQFINIFQTMDTYRELSSTLEMMKDIMPDMGGMSGLGDLSSLGDLGLFGNMGGWSGFGNMGGGNDNGQHHEHHGDEHHQHHDHQQDNEHHHHESHHDNEHHQHESHHDNERHQHEPHHDNERHQHEPHRDSDSHNGGGMDMMNMMMSMLTPEQLQMFELFGGNQIE